MIKEDNSGKRWYLNDELYHEDGPAIDKLKKVEKPYKCLEEKIIERIIKSSNKQANLSLFNKDLIELQCGLISLEQICQKHCMSEEQIDEQWDKLKKEMIKNM